MNIQNTLKTIYDMGFKHRGKLFIIVVLLFLVSIVKDDPRYTASQATGGRVIFNTNVATDDYNDTDGGIAYEESFNRVGSIAISPPIPGSAAGVIDPNFKDKIDTTKRIVKTAGLTIEVDRISQSIEAISNIAAREQGFVLNSNFSEDRIGVRSANITIRVPVKQFEKVLEEIKEQAIFVANESVNGRDVTEEFVDVQAQLINLRAEEKQFLTILQRAVKIEDILAVTRELSRVRGQIERLEGRLRFLENQTDLSTISITLREQSDIVIPTSKWRPLNVIRQSGRDIVDSFQEFIDDSIRFVGSIVSFIPQLILLGIIFLIIRRFVRKKNNNR